MPFVQFGQFTDLVLLVLRVTVGAIFIAHGLSKRPMWRTRPSEGMSARMLGLMRFLSIVEPLGGVALILGFLTPFAAFGHSIVMIGATYLKIFVWKSGFRGQQGTGWEFDLLILAACLAIIVLGAGAWSLDRLVFGA